MPLLSVDQGAASGTPHQRRSSGFEDHGGKKTRMNDYSVLLSADTLASGEHFPHTVGTFLCTSPSSQSVAESETLEASSRSEWSRGEGSRESAWLLILNKVGMQLELEIDICFEL